MVPFQLAMMEEGTYVLAYNEETGETGYYPILVVWSHEDPVNVYLTIDSETIITTPEHPFYTDAIGWEEAGNLKLGDLQIKVIGLLDINRIIAAYLRD